MRWHSRHWTGRVMKITLVAGRLIRVSVIQRLQIRPRRSSKGFSVCLFLRLDLGLVLARSITLLEFCVPEVVFPGEARALLQERIHFGERLGLHFVSS